MAKRTTYGRTPWGEYFISTLHSHNEEGRLGRGKTYANTGRVAKLTVTGPKVSAMVEGNYQPWYRVSLNFPNFEEDEKQAILSLIGSKPQFLAAIGAGALPMELVEELAAARVDLLPRNWSRLKRSCDCPDVGDPCKHMAAVYYVLAQEIDQNPFSLFLLRGLDLKKEFAYRGSDFLPPPLALKERQFPWTPPDSSPFLTLRDNYLAFQLALLKASPSFSSRDFKVVLTEFLHFRQRRYESVLTWGPVQTERSLSESEFTLTGPLPAKGQNWLGELPGLDAAHPALKNVSGAMADFCARFLACSSDQGTQSYRFFFHLYRAFYLLLRAGAWVPALAVSGRGVKILWKPLSSVPEVAQQMETLAALAPPLFWADGRSTVEFLLGVLGTEFVHRLPFLPSGSKRLDPIEAVFFSPASLETSTIAYQSTPLAIASWLAVLDQRSGVYQYRFSLKSARSHDGYQLAVSLRQADPNAEQPWLPLHEASSQADPVEALRFSVMLASYLPELISLQTTPYVVLSEDRLVAFLGEASSVLTRLGVEVQLPKELSRALKPQLTVAVKTKTSGNLESFLSLPEMLDYQWSVAVGGQVFTKAEFQALVKRSRGLIRLKDGYLTLGPEEIRRWLEPQPRVPGFRDALAAFLDGGPAFTSEARSLCENLFRQKELAPPAGLNATLRPYQASGLAWVWNNLMNGFGCLLADDMGLGKTIQTIGVLSQFQETGRLLDPCLIVVPASLMNNWQRELARFAPGLSVSTFHGPGRRLPEKADVIISTYETVLRDMPLLFEQEFSLLILDEAHGLKNVNSKKSQSIRRLKGPVLALSGTPVENRLEDLRAIFDLVMPGYLGPAEEFRQQWRIPIELHRNAEQAERLKRITSPFMLRRLKTDPAIVPDLPPKTVIDEYATLSKPQAVLYATVLEELAKDDAFDDPMRRNSLVLKLLTALKQVCNHPRAYDGESPLKAELSGKTMLLKELLSSILENGEKVIVFSQYVETLKLLEHVIRQDLGEAPLLLHGGMRPADRTRSVDRFQTDPASKIFLISLKAGGVGLNLTAASQVIHYDLWYNPAVENQATDRAFRIGQRRQVFVHRLICSGTFEEKIDTMIKAKQELADLSVAQGESWLADLEPEDLKSLFRLPTN